MTPDRQLQIVTGRVRPTAERLIASKLGVRRLAAGIYREFYGRFLGVAGELGFDPKSSTTPDEVEGVQGIDENSERVRADLSVYGQVGVGWADHGKGEPSL